MPKPTDRQTVEPNNSVRVFRDEANRFIFYQRRIHIVAFYSSRGGRMEWCKQHL